MFIACPPAHLSVSSVIMLEIARLELEGLCFTYLISNFLSGLDLCRFGLQNFLLDRIFLTVIPIAIIGFFSHRTLFGLRACVSVRIRILILPLVDKRVSLFFLLGVFGLLASPNLNEHLILETIEAIVVWFVILAFSRGQFLVLGVSSTRPLTLSN